ncbi:MAG: hypothetical protein LAT82_01015 [Nanoarchaeota archaeon]|nr:hypothetical protein [Nanoarchaeota archaeon]
MSKPFEYQIVSKVEDDCLVLERTNSQLSLKMENLFNDINTKRLLDSTVSGVIPRRLLSLDEVLTRFN